MKSQTRFLLVASFCCVLFSAKLNGEVMPPQKQHVFSATTNYMSRGGYERWRTYQKTGVWWSGTTYVKNDVQFLTSDYAASLALQIAKKAFREYPYTRSFFISGDLRMFGLEWDDHYPFGAEYRRDQRKLYSDYVYRVQEGEKVELRLYQKDNKRKIN